MHNLSGVRHTRLNNNSTRYLSKLNYGTCVDHSKSEAQRFNPLGILERRLQVKQVISRRGILHPKAEILHSAEGALVLP